MNTSMNTFSGVQMSPSSGSLTTGIHFTGAASPTSVNYAAQVQAVPMHQVQAVPVQVHAVPAPKEKVVYQNKYINREVPVEVDRLVKEEVVVYVDKPYEVEKIVTVPVDKIVEKIVEVDKERVVLQEVPVTTEKIVEVPREVIKHVEIPVEKIVTREKVVEVPVEKVVEKTKVVEVPVEKVIYQEKIVEVPVEKIRTVEVIKHVEVPVEKIIYKDQVVEVEKVVYKDKIVEVPVERVVIKEKFVEVPGPEKIVYQDRPVEVERIKPVEVIKHVEVPVEKIVERIKEVPVDRIVTVEKIVDRPVEKIVPVEKLVEVPVDRVIKASVQHCNKCHHALDGLEPCPVCPLMKRLNQPQAPNITSQQCDLKDGYFQWVDGVDATVTVSHSQKDGWQRPCPVTIYATIDGTEPGKNNFAFSGSSPLLFRVSRSCIVHAVAVQEHDGPSSVTIAQKFRVLQPAGIGIELKKLVGIKGVYVNAIAHGGSVWKDGNIKVGDELKMVDSEKVEHLEIMAINRLIAGQTGQPIRLKILREDRDEDGNVVDEVGSEFWVTILRAQTDKNANAAERNMPRPVTQLEGYRRVELDRGSGDFAKWSKDGLMAPQMNRAGDFVSQSLTPLLFDKRQGVVP